MKAQTRLVDVTERVAPARLILEGADATGKTTIAKRIAEDTRATYIHAGPPTRETWETEYLAPLMPYRLDLVLDRWHLGELIWPAIFNRPALMAGSDVVECSDALADMGFVLWVVVRRISEIHTTLVERGEGRESVNAIAGQGAFLDLFPRIQPMTRLPMQIVQSDELMEVTRWLRSS